MMLRPTPLTLAEYLTASAAAQDVSANNAGNFWTVHKLEQDRILKEKEELLNRNRAKSVSLTDLLIADIRRAANI